MRGRSCPLGSVGSGCYASSVDDLKKGSWHRLTCSCIFWIRCRHSTVRVDYIRGGDGYGVKPTYDFWRRDKLWPRHGVLKEKIGVRSRSTSAAVTLSNPPPALPLPLLILHDHGYDEQAIQSHRRRPLEKQDRENREAVPSG